MPYSKPSDDDDLLDRFVPCSLPTRHASVVQSLVSALEAFRYLRLPVVELMQRYLEDRAPFRLPVEVVYGVVLFFGVGGAPDGLLTAALPCRHSSYKLEIDLDEKWVSPAKRN
jgi:hypothetical protein